MTSSWDGLSALIGDTWPVRTSCGRRTFTKPSATTACPPCFACAADMEPPGCCRSWIMSSLRPILKYLWDSATLQPCIRLFCSAAIWRRSTAPWPCPWAIRRRTIRGSSFPRGCSRPFRRGPFPFPKELCWSLSCRAAFPDPCAAAT